MTSIDPNDYTNDIMPDIEKNRWEATTNAVIEADRIYQASKMAYSCFRKTHAETKKEYEAARNIYYKAIDANDKAEKAYWHAYHAIRFFTNVTEV